MQTVTNEPNCLTNISHNSTEVAGKGPVPRNLGKEFWLDTIRQRSPTVQVFLVLNGGKGHYPKRDFCHFHNKCFVLLFIICVTIYNE
jgi:hypothetical protein